MDLDRPRLVKEDEIERKAHAEGVNARAARDQQPGASLVAIEQCEPEQAATEPTGNVNLTSENGPPREASQPRAECPLFHRTPKSHRRRSLPRAG